MNKTDRCNPVIYGGSVFGTLRATKSMMRSVQIGQESLIRRAAGTTEAGPSIEDAGKVCDRLAREGIANTVCFWDVYANRPDFVSRTYAGILAVAKNTSDCYL